jgi:hypothetical protein
MKKVFLLLIFTANFFALFAQQKPRVFFAKDSISLGDTVPLSVTFTHNDLEEVFFPDSAYDFSPFEYAGKRFFATRTQTGLSRDSAVYLLRTFALDSIQKLAFPVFILKKKQDTLSVFSDSAQIPVSFVMQKLPDSVVLKSNTKFVPFYENFNHPLLITIFSAFAVFLFILYLLFGEKIRKMIRLKRLKHQFEKFKNEYEKAVELYSDAAQTDHALGIWKKFLEKMTEMPFSSLTTREISELLKGQEYDHLKKALKEIDVAIYGNQMGEKTKDALLFLKNYAENTFENTIKQV